eukprot:5701110-Amphidinium_carterae.1
MGAFLLRSEKSLLDKLKAVKDNEAQKCCVFLSKLGTEEAIEGAGLNKQTDGTVRLDVFQCKHADKSDSKQDVDEIRNFAVFVKDKVHGWAKGLGCQEVMATFATDRLARKWQAHKSLLATDVVDGVTLRFRLYTRNA